MKKFLLFALALCLSLTSFIFVGCGASDIILTGGPAYEEAVLGNGGMVVRKGDYIYFANGYVESGKLTEKKMTNEKGSVTNGGLYRAKLVEGEDGKSKLEEVQLMVSKVVGFENAGLFIFKDKIYFASPSIEKDNSGTRYDLITFFSCNLDGSGLQTFYQTLEFGSGAKFSMTMINEKVYLLIFTGTKIIKVEENGTAVDMADNVTSVVFPVRRNILDNEENPSVNESFVYYTIDKEKDGSIDLGNILYKKDIVTNIQTELYNVNYIKIKLLYIESNRLFYSRNTLVSKTTYSYYSNSLASENFETSELRHTMNEYSGLLPLKEKEGQNLGLAFIYNGKIYVRGLNETDTVTEFVSASSMLDTDQGHLYYISSDKIYRIDITDDDSSSKAISGSLTINTKGFDLDSDFCYFLVEDTSTKTGYSLYWVSLDEVAGNNATPEKMVG
jgi:hypothetical protein